MALADEVVGEVPADVCDFHGAFWIRSANGSTARILDRFNRGCASFGPLQRETAILVYRTHIAKYMRPRRRAGWTYDPARRSFLAKKSAMNAFRANIQFSHKSEATMRDQPQVKPLVDRVFAFEELKEAMAYLKSGAQFGKICIAH